ncbi:MAG TPA: hypothetical protein PLB89_04930 [Flavobacteriales bacterium]|nr:hypothetical protein [Flavobacteriales bacterium]
MSELRLIDPDAMVLISFGMHYDRLDHDFRRKTFTDPMAVQSFVVGPVRRYQDNWADTGELAAHVYFDTVAAVYDRIEYMCAGQVRRIMLNDLKL